MHDKLAQEHQLKLNENAVKGSYKFRVKRYLVDSTLLISTLNGHHQASCTWKNININSAGFLINLILCVRSHYLH